jgi:Uma2 family endonuclease
MAQSLVSTRFPSTGIYYPDSDGLPMANNALHEKYITNTKHGIESAVKDRDDVFVAADLFWYPVKGNPKIVLAPDVIVAVGRPKGERKSYKQWEEDNIPPQIVFEYLSDANTAEEMINKAYFFERYGVQEYYVYDIERHILTGFIRYQEHDQLFEKIADMQDWVSPRLRIRFDMSSGSLQLYKPDNTPFLSFSELENILEETAEKLDRTTVRLERIEERLERTTERLDETQSELDETRKQKELLAAKLRELGINPDTL